MDELDDLKFNCRAATSCRRRASGIGVGGAGGAARSPAARGRGRSAERQPRRPDAPLLASPHFVPRAKRVIYLFQSGGPSQLELFDYKPLLRTMNGEELPGVGPHGPAPDRHDRVPEVVPAGRLAVRVRPARQERHVGQRAAAPHRADRRRALHRQIDAHRGDQPRPGGDVLPDRIAAGRPARDRRVALLRARVGERQPARRSSSCCRARAKATSRSTRGCGAAASCPRSTRACSSAAARIPVLYLSDPDGDRPRPPAGAMLDTLRALEQQQHARVMDPEIDARIAQYEMAYRMQTAVPDAMDLTDEPDAVFEIVRRRTRASPAPSPPTACWRAAWPSATCASSSSITRAGTSTATCPSDIRTMTKSVGPGVGGAGHGPEAARAARRHARASGAASSAGPTTRRAS